MGEIIERDFGKDAREHARRLARLLGLLEEREADMLANPGEYLRMAADRLAEMAQLKHELYDSIHQRISLEPYDPRKNDFATVNVQKSEWERWKKVKSIIRDRCL